MKVSNFVMLNGVKHLFEDKVLQKSSFAPLRRTFHSGGQFTQEDISGFFVMLNGVKHLFDNSTLQKSSFAPLRRTFRSGGHFAQEDRVKRLRS